MSTDIFSEEPKQTQFEHSIALIGMACKFPGASNPEMLWENILSKNETIHFFDKQELLDAGFSQKLIENHDYIPARGILTEVDKFDAAFFDYSPFEANIMDPQHRVFLEHTWAALENSGYVASKFPGLIGLFAGMTDSTYLTHNLLKNTKLLEKWDEYQIMLATSAHFLCTKVAYALGLTGPCVNISTACSTSLVSIIMACESLLNYDCDMALAGGITIAVPEHSGYLYQDSGISSPDGHCRTFDKDAKGTVISNGCGIVVLKRLGDAIKDKDNIISVIKGWAINNDGLDKAGFTAPSINGQAACINQALAYADISPTEIEYLEAHGTGTILGDPIEVAALTKGYQYNAYQKSQYCAIGSIKPNIGHTDVAAGVAGFIKTALVLKEKILPPLLHYASANERIDFKHSPFYVNTEPKYWEPKAHPRTAAVNSLGFGGTNAHLIMQEAPQVKTSASKSSNVLVVSAKTLNSLETTTKELSRYLQKIQQDENSNETLANAAYTLQLGREDFKWRRAIAFSDIAQLLQTLNDPMMLKKHTNECQDNSSSRIIFGFPGQGTQYANMALDIYKQSSFFKNIIDDCSEQLISHIGVDLRDFLFPSEENVEHANEQLRNTQYAQPALFIIEYALSQLLIDLGIKPNAMIGHSIGEYVAATLSGVLNLQDALYFIATRAKLMAKTDPGIMLAVPLSKEKISDFLTAELNLAAHNAPELCVVSGSKDNVSNFEKAVAPLLKENGLTCIKLQTSHAFHSYLMESILNEFEEIFAKTSFEQPKIPYISNLTGQWVTHVDIENPRYWTNHLRHTVQFSEGVQNLALSQKDIFIEVGPGRTLSGLIAQHKNAIEKPLFTNTLPQAKDFHENKTNSYKIFLDTIGTLWLHNKKITWKNLYTEEIRKRIPLPTYSFERQKHWIHPDSPSQKSIHINLDNENCYAPTWERDINLFSINNSSKPALSKNSFLIFCNKDTLCDELVSKLKAENHLVYTILSDKNFSKISQDTFTLSPENRSHYIKLVESINVPEEKINIIHTWLLNDKNDTPPSDIMLHGTYSLLFLSQAFLEIYPEKNLRILTLSNNVHKILGNEPISPEKITAIGPCRVIPQEQENITCKFIDIDLDNIAKNELIEAIYWESKHISIEDCQIDIAYRGNYRWLKHFKPCSEYINSQQTKRLKTNGIYLITGGLGGIGLEIAKHLAKHYQAHLILTTRRKDFSKVESLASSKLHALNMIEQDASSLTIMQAFVENETQMAIVIKSIHEKFGRIDGLIHAAGLPGDGIAQLKTIDEYQRVLQPKLEGTKILIKLLKNEPLDFVVFFSSITAITGFPGQTDYCSANLGLDAYAFTTQFSHPVFCLTINWESWREIGMAAESKTKLISLNEENSLSPNEGLRLFEKILNGQLNQVVVSNSPPDKFSPIHSKNLSQQTNTQDNLVKSSNNIDNIILTLTDLWRDSLGIDVIDLDDDFYDLGGNSLLAINLLTKIRNSFGCKISIAILLKSKTIRALSEIIALSKQEQETSPIVTLQEGDQTKPPLFILHPIGGTVFCYMSLAQQLRKDRPIYGLQDPSIEQEKPLFNTLEEMATYYRKAIQEIQPVGPYYLCGASFGATLAVEIAHQLLQKNERVNFLGLLDGWGAFSSIQRDKNYAHSIILRHQQDENSRVLPKGIENLSLWEDLFKYRIKIMLNYQPKIISIKLTLFKAKELFLEYQEIEAKDNHWSPYSTLPIEIYETAGDHNTMLQQPYVLSLAKQIQQCLDTSDANTSKPPINFITFKQKVD